MSKNFHNRCINRVIDANLNRAKEGLRVCEEITRFVLENRSLTKNLKSIRHEIDTAIKNNFTLDLLLKERNSPQDIGRRIHLYELKRGCLNDILFANMQRVKESLRVLEEFSKLKNIHTALKFKRMRYKIYHLEKRLIKKAKAR